MDEMVFSDKSDDFLDEAEEASVASIF